MVTDLLHPAQRRLMTAEMPPQGAHDVQLRPLGDGDSKSIIVTSSAHDFVRALLEDLKGPSWRSNLDPMRRRRVASDGVLGLGLPMHGRFQIALFEAWCARPGRPRLDPARITGSGIVIRRLRGSQREGWMKRGKSIDGWTELARADVDPDPALAAAPLPANAAIRAAIEAKKGVPARSAAETVHMLYPAPPDVCAAIGRTILFAVIPVASNEVSDAEPPGIDFQALPASERAAMVAHLSRYLSSGPATPMPRGGATLDPSWNVLDSKTLAAEPTLASLGTFLHQAMVELDALGPSRASKDLLAVLRELQLPSERDDLGRPTAYIDAARFVSAAGPILITRQGNASGFKMPWSWPDVSQAQGERIAEAALACLTEQYKSRARPEGKFANANALYAVRGFIRVESHDDCPDKLIWSMESEPFRILQWWDGEGPAATINLPDLASLKKVKPSVAFAMPPEIANLLKGDLKKVSDGEGEAADTSGVAWLCSFSMPYITICAFIVLNIFLGLLNIVFQWMLFIKICIPIPKAALPPPSGSG